MSIQTPSNGETGAPLEILEILRLEILEYCNFRVSGTSSPFGDAALKTKQNLTAPDVDQIRGREYFGNKNGIIEIASKNGPGLKSLAVDPDSDPVEC